MFFLPSPDQPLGGFPPVGDLWRTRFLTLLLCALLKSCPFSLSSRLVLSVPGNESVFNDGALIWVEET